MVRKHREGKKKEPEGAGLRVEENQLVLDQRMGVGVAVFKQRK